MFGVKTGNAFLQHATYRMEGAKDDDSISGVRCGDGSAQCRQGGRMHARGHFPVPRQSLPCRLQGAPRCRPRRGQIGEVPTVHQRADPAQHQRQVGLAGHGQSGQAGHGGLEGGRGRAVERTEQVVPGQAAVLYDGERVLGGGWIAQTQGADLPAAA